MPLKTDFDLSNITGMGWSVRCLCPADGSERNVGASQKGFDAFCENGISTNLKYRAQVSRPIKSEMVKTRCSDNDDNYLIRQDGWYDDRRGEYRPQYTMAHRSLRTFVRVGILKPNAIENKLTLDFKDKKLEMDLTSD